jgi:hypothetical protein
MQDDDDDSSSSSRVFLPLRFHSLQLVNGSVCLFVDELFEYFKEWKVFWWQEIQHFEHGRR